LVKIFCYMSRLLTLSVFKTVTINWFVMLLVFCWFNVIIPRFNVIITRFIVIIQRFNVIKGLYLYSSRNFCKNYLSKDITMPLELRPSVVLP
jgi:hypothetical protein